MEQIVHRKLNLAARNRNPHPCLHGWGCSKLYGIWYFEAYLMIFCWFFLIEILSFTKNEQTFVTGSFFTKKRDSNKWNLSFVDATILFIGAYSSSLRRFLLNMVAIAASVAELNSPKEAIPIPETSAVFGALFPFSGVTSAGLFWFLSFWFVPS